MSPSSFPGMQAPASGLDRPHPACASEHVALSPRTPSCASTALGLLRHLQSHDDDPWLVGDALNGRGLVPTSSSPLRSQSHGDNAWPDADLDSLGSLPHSGSWTPNQLRSMSFENLQVGSVSLGSGSVGSPVTSVPQAGSNSRQCDWAALASSDNSLSRAFANLDSVRGDRGTSGCHPGHRGAVNVEQQACRTVLPPLGNCFREAATRSCTVSHTCQGTTGSGGNMQSLAGLVAGLARHAAGGSHHSHGDAGTAQGATGSGGNMQSLAGLARRAAGGSHYSNWDAGTAHGGVGDRSASIRDKDENTRSAASQHCLGSLPGKVGVAAAATVASTDEVEGSFSTFSGRRRRSTREMAASTDEVEGSFAAYSGRRRRSTREMAATAAAAAVAAETAEANNKNKNCHFCEHAPKRSPVFACCSPTCDQVCLSMSHAVAGPFVRSRALGHWKLMWCFRVTNPGTCNLTRGPGTKLEIFVPGPCFSEAPTNGNVPGGRRGRAGRASP